MTELRYLAVWASYCTSRLTLGIGISLCWLFYVNIFSDKPRVLNNNIENPIGVAIMASEEVISLVIGNRNSLVFLLQCFRGGWGTLHAWYVPIIEKSVLQYSC